MYMFVCLYLSRLFNLLIVYPKVSIVGIDSSSFCNKSMMSDSISLGVLASINPKFNGRIKFYQ